MDINMIKTVPQQSPETPEKMTRATGNIKNHHERVF